MNLRVNLTLFRPGMRVAVAVSGGADSVALLRALVEARAAAGIVLAVVHVHHGIRGEQAEMDAEFVSTLASLHGLPLHLHRVDAPAAARANHESLEEAARNLRYECFDSLLAADGADAVATAHTLDDQAETVLHRLLRGAWTEGLGGIHPVVQARRGCYLRPLLGARRVEIEAYLAALHQSWREDVSNLDIAFTRNRIRGELMPSLCTYNPQIETQLAHLSAIARDEEDYWAGELGRLLPSLLLPGKAVRGGGRAATPDPSATMVALEIERLRTLMPAVRRRVLRAAAANLDHSLSFDHTEALLSLCGFTSATTTGRGGAARPVALQGRSSSRLDLSAQLRVERTPRELRFILCATKVPLPSEYRLPLPGKVIAQDFGLVIRAVLSLGLSSPVLSDDLDAHATVRPCRSSDRLMLKHSSGPKTVKEVLERLHLGAAERVRWPLVEWQGEVIWLRGVEVESRVAEQAGIVISASKAHKEGEDQSG